MKQETKVGMVIIVGLLVFAIAIMILSGVRVFERGYKINILFNDIQGLLKQAKVQVAGVNVGYVKDIILEGDRARVNVWLNSDVKIHKDSAAYIFSSGIIGVKFIQLTSGTTFYELLKDEDVITGVDPISIDKMFEKTQTAVNSLLDSLKGLTGDTSIKMTIDNLNKFSSDLTVISREVRKSVSDGRFDRISKKLDNTLTSLESLSKSAENGDGLLGKLFSDKKLEKDFRETISSMRVFSKVMEDAPSSWIVDDKKAKEIKKNLEKETKKEQ
ncbi:MAG: MlaD family protein [Elusimicrobia bacterium]|nr:MlaD family protein [Elusimicrobiota bacterium]